MSQRAGSVRAPEPGEPVDLRVALVEARRLKAQVDTAVLALEGGLQAQPLLKQAETQVQTLSVREGELKANISALEHREAVAKARTEGAEGTARDEVVKQEATVTAALTRLNADLAEAQRKHAADLKALEDELQRRTTAATQEISDTEAKLERVRREAGTLAAGLVAAR